MGKIIGQKLGQNMVAKNELAGYRQTTNACWFRWRFTQIASVRSSLQQLQHASPVRRNALLHSRAAVLAAKERRRRKTMKKAKPFWDESYKRPGKLDTFGNGQPDKDVEEIAIKIGQGRRALDLGCGEGRNAIFLAKQGFVTTAFDISANGIEKVLKTAADYDLNIEAFICDMREYTFPHSFDLIVCSGCLHLVNKCEWAEVVNQMKKATNVGGYNAVGIFTDTVPEPEDQRCLMIGLAAEGELYDLYNDWEIVKKNSFCFEHQHPDGPKHKHSGNRLLAKKK